MFFVDVVEHLADWLAGANITPYLMGAVSDPEYARAVKVSDRVIYIPLLSLAKLPLFAYARELSAPCVCDNARLE